MITWREFAAAAPHVSAIFARRHREADWVYRELGHDIRGVPVADNFFVADLEGASSVEADGQGLKITLWKAGGAERVTRPGARDIGDSR